MSTIKREEELCDHICPRSLNEEGYWACAKCGFYIPKPITSLPKTTKPKKKK